MLAKLIELLAARDSRGMPTAMIYASDHGESLGESNVYLHGLPYAFAPDVQKHVPMLMWLSPKLQADFRIDAGCLEHRRHEPVSHDNFFHSVLGLLDVRTSAYHASLDIFAGCRGVFHRRLSGGGPRPVFIRIRTGRSIQVQRAYDPRQPKPVPAGELLACNRCGASTTCSLCTTPAQG